MDRCGGAKNLFPHRACKAIEAGLYSKAIGNWSPCLENSPGPSLDLSFSFLVRVDFFSASEISHIPSIVCLKNQFILPRANQTILKTQFEDSDVMMYAFIFCSKIKGGKGNETRILGRGVGSIMGTHM